MQQNSDQINSVNVKALKMFFQNKNCPIMRLRSESENKSVMSGGHSETDTNADIDTDADTDRCVTQMPRPPSTPPSTIDLIKALPQMDRPIPKPRKSLQMSASLDNDLSEQLDSSLHVSHEMNLNHLNIKHDKPITNSETVNESLNSAQLKRKTNKSKSRPFRSLIKSLSKRNNEKHSKVRQYSSGSTSMSSDAMCGPYVRPTRKPPIPPLLKFRPAAPLPLPSTLPLPSSSCTDDFYEDTANNNTTCYELYNDSSHQIYSRLNNDDDSDESDIYESIDVYDDGLVVERSFEKHDLVNYYEDNAEINSDLDDIYEVLPFEKDQESDKSTFSLVSLEEEKTTCNKNYSKKEVKINKIRKKFNITGNEIAINDGIVKEGHKGTNDDLFVKKGEIVHIIRMEANPPGKWLATNNRGKVGYVDLSNISFDAETVKSVIRTLVPNKY